MSAGPTFALPKGMNAALDTIRERGGITLEVVLGQSTYGRFPEPRLEVRMGKPTSFRALTCPRALSAMLHALAAEVELATEPTDCWVVDVSTLSDRAGRVSLELGHATDEEAQRGLALLERIARAAGGHARTNEGRNR